MCDTIKTWFPIFIQNISSAVAVAYFHKSKYSINFTKNKYTKTKREKGTPTNRIKKQKE